MGYIYAILILLLAMQQPAYAAFDSAEIHQNKDPLKITRITPSGEQIQPSRQIVFEFNRPVVPVGEMAREASQIPITISPQLACEWRWLNTTSLACQLGQQAMMKPATHYQIHIKPGIITEDGIGMQRQQTHQFSTIRPAITYYYFQTWTAPGMPVIHLNFNQSVRLSSLKESFRFVTPGGSKIPVSINVPDNVKALDAVSDIQISPAQELPLNSPVSLFVYAGIQPAAGLLPGNEQKTIVRFDTFPEFRFLGIECRDNKNQPLLINFDAANGIAGNGMENNAAVDAYAACNPLNWVALRFSAPVIKDEVKQNIRLIPDLAGGRTDYDPWARLYDGSYLRQAYEKNRVYYIHLPENLKAYQDYQLLLNGALADEFGRKISGDIDMKFRTDHRTPDYHFEHNVSVLEKGVDTHLPIVVTNIDSLNIQYSTQDADGVKLNQQSVEKLPKAEDIAYRHPIKIRELLPAASGVVTGTLTITPDESAYTPWFFSQVTPFQVHVKSGHFNTLVWVTDMHSGRAVSGAKVDIYLGDMLAPQATPASLSSATTDRDGVAMLAGSESLDPANLYRHRSNPHEQRLMVRVGKGDDIALLSMYYEFFANPGGSAGKYIPNQSRKKFGHIRTWGTTAQGIYKAGSTVEFKLYARNQDNKQFTAAPAGKYALKVVDPMGKTMHEVREITLNDFGAYAGEFIVPETAAVGWYHFYLNSNFTDEQWEPLKVLVSDFTPSPFHVVSELNGDLFTVGSSVHVATHARLHAGGPYAEAGARVTATLVPTPIYSKNPKFEGFRFDSQNYSDSQVLHQSQGMLDANGEWMTPFVLPQSYILHGRLTVESAVRDERGKFVAGSSSASFVSRDRFAGIRQSDWILHAGKKASLEGIVIDSYGEAVEGHNIQLSVLQRITKAARVKGSGNAYLTQYSHTWEPLQTCNLTTSETPSLCEFTPPETGYYRLEVSTSDSSGQAHQSQSYRWALGKGEVLWEMPEGHELQITAEKNEYKVGDTARYLVQNPYPGGRALITKERFGVMKKWVKVLNDATEVIEVPVEADDLPGFYLSVVVTSPRVDKPLSEDQVDLGKPAFRMGYITVPVIDPAKQIKVSVKPERQTYKPRETVKVKLKARTPGWQQEPVEMAVAVLDESVFDLLSGGTRNFDPLRGFYNLEPLDLENYNLLKMLVGKQKFEAKGANAGGDGGSDLNLRSIFKFVSYWNPSVVADKHGEAEITFALPDNLTGWRVLAMAVTKDDKMGLGEANFKVNQPTEIRTALPNQVIERDTFTARFSVMNRTQQMRQLKVKVHAAGAITGPSEMLVDIYAEPFKRQYVEFPVTAGADGEIIFTVRAGDALDSDATRVRLPVHKLKALESAATYGTTTTSDLSESVQFPENMRDDMGSVSVVASSSVINGVETAFEYMRDYPYICWEQKLSKAVMAAHYRNLKPYIADTFTWNLSDSLTQDTLNLASTHQAPNGGMVYYIPANEYVSPYLSAYTALAFNWLKNSGYQVPQQVEQKLHGYLLKLLRQEVLPSFYSSGMSSTVRAVALAALASNGKVSHNDLLRYQKYLPQMSLFGKAHYLQAATAIGADLTLQQKVVDMLYATANETGGKFMFSEPVQSGFERILATPLRSNCAVLTSLLEFERVNHKDSATPFKLVRFISQSRNRNGYWQNTQENMFCMNALIDFSREYEQVPPHFTLQASMDDTPMGETAAFTDVKDPPVLFERPVQAGDPGRKTKVDLHKQGEGRYYYATRLSFSPKELKKHGINAGIEARREYHVQRDSGWVRLTSPMQIQRGELVRVDLYLSLPAPRNFVVVDDPVPGGLEPVNRDLATASVVDANQAGGVYAGDSFWYQYQDWISYDYSRWSFYHKELRHDSVRFYSEYLPAGNYHLSYTAQAIASGAFSVPPLHAEEMYDPDVFGQGAPAQLQVEANGDM
ncbi:MAG: hypothetical protein AUJ56_03105 [Zetaproteobacteria bacterium CG1_02_49_23]|nr:MAG: hypothetical protein AUJ56_03105 [Zetaproteobacteria bacterium CG1_02_49_23]